MTLCKCLLPHLKCFSSFSFCMRKIFLLLLLLFSHFNVFFLTNREVFVILFSFTLVSNSNKPVSDLSHLIWVLLHRKIVVLTFKHIQCQKRSKKKIVHNGFLIFFFFVALDLCSADEVEPCAE